MDRTTDTGRATEVKNAHLPGPLVAVHSEFYRLFCDKLRITGGEMAAATGYSRTFCAEVKRGERTRVAVRFLTEVAAYMRIRASGSDAMWYQALLAD